MKNESLEDELRLLKIDINNLNQRLNMENQSIFRLMENIKEQMDFLFAKLDLKPLQRLSCQKCEGYGEIYISPIADCGQSNVCMNCGGKGYLYK